jgi:dTDP-4-amino-4,6-dideoxygalactose transaminase
MTRRVKYMDLRVQDSNERKKLLKVFNRVMDHGQFIMHREVHDFEEVFSKYCRRRYCAGVDSGTSALFIALQGMNIGPGDEVITTSLSWVATANAIAMTGATPVFCEIKDDLNIDPESVERMITTKTRAILVVHYTGRIVDMDAFIAISEKYGIPLVEDAAQAFGSKYREKVAGSFGYVACFSMNPMKVLASCGEAGAIVTDDLALYERIIALRYNGTVNKEVCIQPSLNGRLDSLQAGILLERMKVVNKKIKKIRNNVSLYNDLLPKNILPSSESQNDRSSFYSYTVQVDHRKELIEFLNSMGIETKVQHPILMCEQKPYINCPKDNTENAQRIVKKILSLPVNETITKDQIHYVSESITKFYINNRA